MKIHQIWIGDELPAREREWVAHIARAAAAAGHEHKLWGLPELLDAFGEEPLGRWLAMAWQTCPGVRLATLASDYYRLRVLAEYGGVYLDTDFVLRGDMWPELPRGNCIWGMCEYFAVGKVATGFFYVPEGMSTYPFRLAAGMAEARLLQAAPPDAPDFRAALDRVTGPHFVLNVLGPPWMREVLLPAWRAAGVEFHIMPANLISHAQWADKGAPLIHVGTAHWVHNA